MRSSERQRSDTKAARVPAWPSTLSDGSTQPTRPQRVRDTDLVRDTDSERPPGRQKWRYSPQVPSLFLQTWGPLLLVLHALGAIVLSGSSVHQALLAIQLLRRKKVRFRLLRVYALTTLFAYLATMTAGLLLYPRYRVLIRALFLDPHAPWAANLFDWKENIATIGLPLSVGALLLASALSRAASHANAADAASAADATEQPEDPTSDRAVLALYAAMAIGTALVTAGNVVAGFLVTSVRGA